MATSVPMSQTTTLHATDEEAPHSKFHFGRASVPLGSDPGMGTKAKAKAAIRPSQAEEPWQKKYPGKGTYEDPYVVDWDLGDPENPFNWSRTRKWAITAQVGCISGVTVRGTLAN